VAALEEMSRKPEARKPEGRSPKTEGRSPKTEGRSPKTEGRSPRTETAGSLLGAHISTAGGVANAPARADAIGATAMQIFTKQPNQWKESEVSPDDAKAFRDALAASGVKFTNAHDSYLINLASPDPALREKSIASFRAELRRCHALGLDALVSHPGNFMDERAAGIARNADAITESLEAEQGSTRLLMELTAGQGTVIGATFEEMAELLSRIPAKLRTRAGVCLDTAHIFAGGYDLIGDYDGVWARFDDVLGIESLGLIHLNDSKAPLGSKKDRHELIGKGEIGKEPFAKIMRDHRLVAIPKLLETPKGDDLITNDRRTLRMLRRFEAKN
jgi:deoxyribonuclease-4